jgi:hypothetical protein
MVVFPDASRPEIVWKSPENCVRTLAFRKFEFSVASRQEIVVFPDASRPEIARKLCPNASILEIRISRREPSGNGSISGR